MQKQMLWKQLKSLQLQQKISANADSLLLLKIFLACDFLALQFAEAVFPALTGGWFVMFMAVFTYIADITSEADRTFRIGVVNVFFSIGIPIGMALSGVMYRLIG